MGKLVDNVQNHQLITKNCFEEKEKIWGSKHQMTIFPNIILKVCLGDLVIIGHYGDFFLPGFS